MVGKIRTLFPSVLADIAFVLIICWVVVAFIGSRKAGAGMDEPRDPSPEEHPIRLIVSVDEKIDLNGAVFTASQKDLLYHSVLEYLQPNPGQPVLLTAEPNVPPGHVVHALDILRTVERDLRRTSPDYRLALTVNTVTNR